MESARLAMAPGLFDGLTGPSGGALALFIMPSDVKA